MREDITTRLHYSTSTPPHKAGLHTCAISGGISNNPVVGNADDVFKQITKGGTPTKGGAIKMPDGTYIKQYSGGSGPTIHVKKPGETTPFKIRIEPPQ